MVDASGTKVEEVDAFELMRPRDSNVPTPTGKAEISVAGIIGPALKLRAGGGIGFPGNNAFGVTLTYFFGI